MSNHDPLWSVEASLESDHFSIQRRTYTLPTPTEFVLCETVPVIGLDISQHANFGEFKPLTNGKADFNKIGRLTFSPPGVPFYVRGSGGSPSPVTLLLHSAFLTGPRSRRNGLPPPLSRSTSRTAATSTEKP